MKQFLTIFFFILIGLFANGFAQISATVLNEHDYLDKLLNSTKTFWEIKEEADSYFQSKYPDLTAFELSSGEFRDGDFVKYQRWLSFWRNQLNEDGTLGDFTQTVSRVNSTAQNRGVRSMDCGDSQILMDWTNINYNGNMGFQIDQGRTSSIAFHPTDANTFYVGAAFGGLWKTVDGGASYINLNDNLPHAAVSSIIIDPENPDRIAIALSDIVWYGPTSIGVFVSLDGGLTFMPTDLAFALNENVRIYYMDQNPENANEIVAATSTGIYKTNDFFTTVTEVHPLNCRSVKYSQTVSNVVYIGGAEGEFYKSTDGGESFDFIQDFGSQEVRLAVPLVAGSTKVVASSGSNLYTSTDHGETFVTKVLPESNMVVEFAVDNDDVINVGNFEVYRSNNFGTSFTPVSHWLGSDGLPFIHVDQRNVFVNPLNPDYVYFCNDGGVSRFTVSTNAFTNLSKDLIITQYYDIAVSQTEEMVVGGGSQDNGNIFREADGNWFSYAPTGDGMGQEIDPVNAGVRYWCYQYGGLRRWEAGVNTGIAPPGEDGMGAWETPFKIDPNNSDRILVGYNSVYASDNNGDSWYTIGDVVNPPADLQQIAIAPSNSEKIYATQYRKLFVKSPGSDAWTAITTPVIQTITDLEVDHLDENIVYISYGGYNAGQKVYKSIDGGENWTNISASLPNLPILSLEVYDDQPGGVFIGTYGAVYYIDDRFTEWLKVGCIPNTAVNDIEIQYFTNKIFIGTHGRGMFEATIEFNFSSLWENEATSENLILLYPNPASDKATIRSNGTDLSNAKIIVTDISGRILDVNYTLNGAGELVLNCENFAAGNYIVKVLSEKNSPIGDLKLVKW